MSKDFKDPAREKKIEILKKNAYHRKINNQYEFLRKWDKGELTGAEACDAIENEGKIFRLESDLINIGKVPKAEKPNG